MHTQFKVAHSNDLKPNAEFLDMSKKETNKPALVCPSSSQDTWSDPLSHSIRRIGNTPYFLSRCDNAVELESNEKRLNSHGYDRDDPKDAIIKYENEHPEPLIKTMWNGFTDSIFGFFTGFIPKLLSLSAGKDTQRIDQKVVLRIVRESVDKFPELKIRISKEAFDLMNLNDQLRWHKEMAIIRNAQHEYIIQELAKAYPGHINQDAPTILYTGGRAAGCLRVLYCSMDEYVALYWSDWGLQSTDSGSYKSHVYDYITEGQNKNWNARYLDFNPQDFEITEPGEYTFLGKGDRKIWSFEGPCGMVDHGLGDAVSMVKFAVVSNVTSTLNAKAVRDLLIVQAKSVAREYWQRLKETLGFNDTEQPKALKIDEKELEHAREFFSTIMKNVENNKN